MNSAKHLRSWTERMRWGMATSSKSGVVDLCLRDQINGSHSKFPSNLPEKCFNAIY